MHYCYACTRRWQEERSIKPLREKINVLSCLSPSLSPSRVIDRAFLPNRIEKHFARFRHVDRDFEACLSMIGDIYVWVCQLPSTRVAAEIVSF